MPDINLQGLGNLDLSYNNLTGLMSNISTEIDGIFSVQLNNNNLMGTISQVNAKQLYYLNLSNNQLTGAIPANLFDNRDMYYLRLNNNKLSGHIPKNWQLAKGLKYFYLNNNMLTGSLFWYPNNMRSESYEFIDVGSNYLSGQIVIPYVTINFLILSNNNFTEDIINAGAVYYIDIRNNNYMNTKLYLDNLLVSIDSYSIYNNMLCPYLKTNIPYTNFDTIIMSSPSYYNYTFCKEIY